MCLWRIVISPMIPRPACIRRCAIRPNFQQRCMKARPDTPISPYYSNIQIAFVLFARSGAPGETRTPGLLVRSHKSKNAKCPIWRRLRTGNAILPSISCTQCCIQNRIISAEFGHAVTASASKLPQQVSVHSEQLAGSGWRIVSRFPSSKPVYGEITIRQRQVPMYNPRRFPPFRSRRSGPQIPEAS